MQRFRLDSGLIPKINSFRLLVLFLFYLSSFSTLPASYQDVLELHEGISRISEKVTPALTQYPDLQSVIVVGKTGSGKTTLMNTLAGKKLKAVEIENSGLHLIAEDPLPGLQISNSNKVGTLYPSSWYNEETRTLFWDCPGFEDSRGPKAKIINNFSIKKLFRSNIPTKVVIAIQEEDFKGGRADPFLKLINRMIGMFHDVDKLSQCATLIVTRARDITNLGAYLEKEVLTLSQDEKSELTTEARELLRQFLDQRPNRLISFPCPKSVGEYTCDLNALKRSINSSNFVKGLSPRIVVDAETSKYAASVLLRLDEHMVDLVKGVVHNEIINYCDSLLKVHNNSFNSSIEQLGEIQSALQILKLKVTPQAPDSFCRILSQTFPALRFDVLQDTIEQISFMKQIGGDVSYNTQKWLEAVQPTVDRIRQMLQSLETRKNLIKLQENLEKLNRDKEELKNQLNHTSTSIINLKVPKGVVLSYAGNTAPQGWLFCFGQAVSRQQYSELFQVIGTFFGAGDNVNTFNLPDLRGRSVFGMDNIGGQAAGRITNFTVTNGGLGAAGGKESHLLTLAEIPSHTHTYYTGTGERTCGSGRPANAENGGNYQHLSTNASGGGQAHSIMPPFIILNYIIRH